MSTPDLTPADIFGDANENHRCCTCCDGYCPWVDMDRKPGPAVLVRAGDYISDRFVAVKADMVTIPDGVTVIGGDGSTPLPKSMSVPDAEPEQESTATFLPSRALRLFGRGIDIRQGASDTTPQHLYRDGEHIGWVMPMRDGLTLDEARDLAITYARIDKAGGKLYAILHDFGGNHIDNLFMLRDAMSEEAL